MSVVTADVDGVMVTTVDDGKVNALSFEIIAGIRSAIATASEQRRPLVITGRDGCLSAGFDLAVVNSGDEDRITALFTEGAELYGAIVAAPIPVIVSCTGHALAGGALLLLSADYRIGRNGTYRLGLNETRIGMALPNFAVDPGHASTRAPVPHRGHHVRRGRSRRSGRWRWASSTRPWTIHCRGPARSPHELAALPHGAVRGDQAPYPADLQQELEA